MFDFLKKKVGSFLDSIVKKDEPEVSVSKDISSKPSTSNIDSTVSPEVSTPEISPSLFSKPVIPPSSISESASMHKSKDTFPEKPSPTQKETLLDPPKSIPLPVSSSSFLNSISKEESRPPQRTNSFPAESDSQVNPEQKKPILDLAQDESKKRVKLDAVSTIKSIFQSEITLNPKELSDLLDNFELELLESDVDIQVASYMRETLNSKLSNLKLPKGKVQEFVHRIILESIIDVLENEKQFDILNYAKASKKPLKIMLLGINGAGKTTTIAKLAHLFSKNNLKVVFAASDTFRAAAVEQLEVHANKLGLKIIKRDYGSDPTSVAFDAVNYATAHNVDVVLIDTAGRQDTNTNLLNEMKKMSRVISPDLKLYIGESIAGSAILDQVGSFNREIGLSGVILTKLDCDPKGGTMLSISKSTGIPILAVTLGQNYDDIEIFDSQKIAKRIVS